MGTASKKKILFISDHAMAPSGVGLQARFLMQGLIKTGRYTFRHLGAAVKHVVYDTIKVDDDLIIKPIDGFGDQNMIRQVLVQERPDAMFLFTDPRFFMHIFAMHDEIQTICPIFYWHLWDDSGKYPPTFNKPIFDICDSVQCINWPTYEYGRSVTPEKVGFIPHAVPPDLYRRLTDEERASWRRQLVGDERAKGFVALFVSRNARRKRPSDIMQGFRWFLDELETDHGHRDATLVMHCNPHDNEGVNLLEVSTMLGIQKNVVFSNTTVNFEQMNGIYNAVDVLINASCNEGWGLPILEAKMAETPCIAIMTGGLTRQIKDADTGYEFGVAMPPDLETLVGNPQVPWIAEDFVHNRTIANAFMKVHEMSVEQRREIGTKAREHALRTSNLEKMVVDWDDELQRVTSMPKRRTWKQVSL